jgi:enoyl-CoA hydratase|tara:strand:+ start:3600 stop:4373 length:774 start_codon:yes stop_codon:yes gene_type:complete
MEATKVSCSTNAGIAILLLEPPVGKPPTIDGKVLAGLEQALVDLNADESLRVVIVRSTSERYFCVGANLNVLKQINEETIVPWVTEGHRIFNLLEDLPVPVVARVDGYAMGGGLELALACDLIFSSDTAKLAQSEAGLGFIPGWGGTRRLANRIGVAKAKHCFYTGQIIDAPDALAMGLVDFSGNTTELEDAIDDFCTAVRATNKNALTQFKSIVNEQHQAARKANLEAEAFRSISCLQDADAKQRLSDFLNKKGSK